MTQLRSFNNFKLVQINHGENNPHSLINYSNGVKLFFGKKEIFLSVGYGDSDTITVYRSGNDIFVLNRHHMPYIGLSHFPSALTHENGSTVFTYSHNCVFAQENWEIEHYIGKNWETLSDITIAKRLIGYIE